MRQVCPVIYVFLVVMAKQVPFGKTLLMIGLP